MSESEGILNRPFKVKERMRLGFVLFIVLAVVILAADITFFTVSIDKPYMGIVLSFSSKGWTVEGIDPNGNAYQQGIRAGDIPVEVNNQTATVFLQKYTGAGAVYGPIIKQLSVVDRSGQMKTAVLNNSLPSFNAVAELSMWLVTCLIFWIIGFSVFFKKQDNQAAKLLCLVGLFFGLNLSANLAAERVIPLAVQVGACTLAVSPTLLLHFFLVLPEERAWLRRKSAVLLIYVPAAVTILLFPLVGYANGQPLPWFRSVRMIEAILLLLVVGGVAIYNYVRAVSPRTRQQMKIMLIGAVVALVPFLVLIFLYTAVWKQNSVPYGVHVLFISFIPVSMGYAVVTQKLLDIDVIIRRGVIYGTITLIMAVILGVGVFLVTALGKSIGIPERVILALVLGGVATVLFGPVLKGVEAAVDRLFYKDRYDYRLIIQDLSSSLNSLKGFSETSRLIVGTTTTALNLAGAAIFVKTLSGPFEISAAQGTFVAPDKQRLLLMLITKRKQMIEFPNSASNVSPDISFMVPLVTGEQEVGILCLSPKATRQNFSSNDIYLIQGIASVAASAIRSAMLVRDVSMRDTFITIASHELRTPLTSILGFSDLLLRKDPSESTRKQWAQNIFSSGKRISTMVDNLLNVSRIQSGKAILKIEVTNLAYVLIEQLDLIKESSDIHRFVLNLAPDLPDALIDRDKFGHVIGNLLSNAVKYSPGGGTVTLSAHRDEKRHRIIVSVADEGMGISPTDQLSLFTTFNRIQRPETRGIAGSGLGLYIAKEWTEAMGGEIWLKSELNKGTTFFVSIPERNSNA